MKKLPKKYAQIFPGLAVTLLGSQLVYAQGPAPQDDQADAPILEEVMVTARKRAENLQDTPLSVSAMSAEALDRRQINGTVDLDKVTPNLQFASYGPLTGNNSASQVFIRGIGQTDATSSVDPGVGLYIDDVYMGSSVGGAMEFRDVSSVQVLRGPQGTLFGRNTIGGAVLLTTTAPGDEFAGSASLGLGSDNLTTLQLATDIPISDSLSSRFTYGSKRRDGYVIREIDGTDLGDDNTFTVSAKFLWEVDGFDATLKLDYSEEDENGAPLVFSAMSQTAAFPASLSASAGCPGATFPPPFVPADVVDVNCANTATWERGEFSNAGTIDLSSTLENSGAALIANWELSENVNLKSVTSYRETEWAGVRDADNTGFVILHTDMHSEGDQLSQEFQLNYDADNLHALFGLFYFDSSNEELLIVNFTPPGAPVIPVNNGADLGNENIAAFTQFTYEINDNWSMTGGIRYTDETKTATIDAFGGPPASFETFGLTEVIPPAVVGTRYVDQDEHTLEFSNTSGHFNVQYRWNDDVMGYASYSEAFKSGGWNPLYNAEQPDLLPTSFNEELAESVELGIKADISPNFRVNAAIFSTDYTDMQFTYRVGIVPLLFNAGEASIKGAELEFSYAPSRELIVEGSVGYLDGRVDSVANITSASAEVTAVVREGNKLPYAPDLTGNLGIGYSLETSNWVITPRLDVSYMDERYFDAGNSAAIAQLDSQITARFAVSFEDMAEKWRLVAGVENLTDDIWPVAGNSSLSTSTGYAESVYSRPRSWYMRAEYNF